MIAGIHHVGISVVDLNRAIQFYRDVLGMELIVEEGFSGHLYEQILALDRPCGKVALLKAGNMRVELFEFSRPSPKPSNAERPVCDHGITHFCFEVVDIASAYERLKIAGTHFHCEPLAFGEDGKAVYGRDPDGNAFEILERNPRATGIEGPMDPHER